jgi:hypothetical protein
MVIFINECRWNPALIPGTTQSMKKIYSVLLFFFATAIVNGQTVTQAFNEPSIGDVDKNYNLDTSAYTSGLPSATGTNVVWDFTQVNGAFPVVIDSMLAPSSAVGGSAHPTATYVQKRSGVNSFFMSAPNQTEWLGVYSPSLSVTFTNSAIIATYPVSYGYSSTDPVTGTFKYNSTTGVCNGKLTVIADGVGTLKLPNNVTFQNVLRLRSVEQLTMTTGFITAGTINQAIFSYYAPGIKYPVITAQYQKYQLVVGTPTITAMAYGNFNYFTVAGLNETGLDPKMEIYPNPFHDKLFAKGDLALKEYEFMLYNVQGQLVERTQALENLSVSGLPPGIYLLEIKNRSGSVYRKMVKE